MPPGPKAIIEHGSRLLSTLTGLYKGPSKDLPPPISERTALLCSVFFTALYIAPFYISPTLRATPLSSRDAPTVIAARIRAVAVTCIACSAFTVFVLVNQAHATPQEVLRLTGFWPVSGYDCANVLGLVIVLFVGPLYEELFVEGGIRHIRLSTIREVFWDDWTGLRNLVVAPLSEELVFRSMVIPLFLIARVAPARIVLLSPLIFGLAHLHHLAEFINAHTPPGHRFAPASIWIRGIIRGLFQFTYTSLFGCFAAFVFLRTGSFWTATLAHSFCNFMGFPRVWGRVGQDEAPASQITPDVAQGKRDEDAEGYSKVGNAAMLSDDEKNTTAARTTSVLPTFLYYTLLVAGAYGFYRLLWPMTSSSLALASFDKIAPKH